MVKILKAFQANDDIYYAYVINNDGFIPAHTDREKSKTKVEPLKTGIVRNRLLSKVLRSAGEERGWVCVL